MKRHACGNPTTCPGCYICGQLAGPLYDCEGCGKIVCDEEAVVIRNGERAPVDTLDEPPQEGDRVVCWNC